MYSKIFKLFLLLIIFFCIKNIVFANSWDQIHIISRQEWWADESYRYLDSPYWKNIIENMKKKWSSNLSAIEKLRAKKEAEKVKIANNFLVKNYANKFWVKSIQKYEWIHKLAWPIARVKNRSAIVIHDTDTNYWTGVDSYEAIRRIYKFHALSRKWWDIGYNYLIGYNWEIFQWRAWWDDVVWAHDKWNNQPAIWISLIWSYDKKNINKKQYESLKKLIKYLVNKYHIDLSKKTDFFKWCIWTGQKCMKKPLVIIHKYPIIWHRDAWYTVCPWKKLYAQLQLLKKQLNVWVNFNNNIFFEKINKYLLKLSDDKLISLLSKIEIILDKNINDKKRNIILWVKKLILNIENTRLSKTLIKKWTWSFDDTSKIKVKLSYPLSDHINLEVSWKYNFKIIKNYNQKIIKFYFAKNKKYKNLYLNIKMKWDFLYINHKKLINFDNTKFFRISVPKWDIIKINSWNRKPKWDKTWKLNDNEFKWDIILYKKANKLIVVNELYLTDYLKWLWEVSNNTNSQKIKTIIVLARTYARWYITKARKFAWEWFDASDNPNVFQKYLWFWLEKRSPKINKIVEQTKDLVVTYNWDLIKPWYFSSSNWKTQSFINYCKNVSWIPDCAHPEKFPFLLGVRDPGGNNKNKLWHWIWVPWTWVKYFSDRWWNFEMIIKYFLKWVRIKYL